MSVWQASYEQVEARGASLAAIAPQAPDVCAKLRDDHDLSFDVLSDPDLTVLDLYGLAFEFPSPVQDRFRGIGLDLADIGGAGHWSVPTPATFVIDRDQRVVFSDVSAEYRRRTEPDLVLAQLR